MIRLELTIAETQQLKQWLTDTRADQPAQAGGADIRQTLLTKLMAAADEATRPLCCLVCRQGFTQENPGRTGQYCSAACKQKAYRQRRQAARKHFGPPRKR